MFISIRRTFTYDSKINNCMVSTDADAKSYTPPKELDKFHHCSNCIDHSKTKRGDEFGQASETNSNATSNANINSNFIFNPNKKPKIQIKKPFLKSIILSATSKNNPAPLLNIKQEFDLENTCENFDTQIGECSTAKYQNEMQFTDNKKTKQINSYFKSNNFVQQKNARSYSPPLPTAHRLASMVTSDPHHTVSNNLRRKSNKKRKKRRHIYSKESRSRSR